MTEVVPKGSQLDCSIIFLEGVNPAKTAQKAVNKVYKYSGSLADLKKAKKDAFDFFKKYVFDFDKKYPNGYVMLHKVEWKTDETSKKNMSVFMKQLEVAGVPQDF